MLYEKMGFRALYHCFYALMINERLKPAIKDFPGADQANCALVYGYIDHKAGLTLEVLALGKKTGDKISFADGNDEIRSFIRMEAVSENEFYPIDDSVGKMHRKKIEMLEAYNVSDDIEETRKMEFLDGCRDQYCIDDVLVRLIKEGLQIEGCWVRIQGLQTSSLKGTLLNEPYQKYGCHVGDVISFGVHEMENGQIICIADMN